MTQISQACACGYCEFAHEQLIGSSSHRFSLTRKSLASQSLAGRLGVVFGCSVSHFDAKRTILERTAERGLEIPEKDKQKKVNLGRNGRTGASAAQPSERLP
jgi:hypothetical protein